jgi:hypothetical protein
MTWEVEGTDEFKAWFQSLTDGERSDIAAVVDLLEEKGTSLGFPRSSDIRGSKHGHMRELRIQHKGHPIRVLYAFNPRRTAILLIGGDKTGNNNWYNEFVPIADKLYDVHLKEIEADGNA